MTARPLPYPDRHIAILSSVHLALDNRVFYREARTLQRAGYKVTLVALHDREEVKDCVRIIPLPTVPRWQRPLLWWRLWRLAVTLDADAYLFHDPELLLISPWIRQSCGRPTIYDIHESYADFVRVKDYLPGWLRQGLSPAVGWFEPRLAARESGLLFADDAIAADFTALNLPKATLFNFPSPRLVERAMAEAALPYAERKATILYLGGMEHNRGSDLMLAAFRQVLDTLPQARLLVVGHFMPPELEQEMRAEADRLGIGKAMTLTGRVPFEQIGHYLRQARAGWITWQPVTKNRKNIPTKLFEYMAYALPVVSSDLESVRPFIRHGIDGMLVAADDPAGHARALLHLLQAPADAERMGLAGQDQIVSRFNWSAMEPRFLALVDEVLDRHANRFS